jgi:hypothetical protein
MSSDTLLLDQFLQYMHLCWSGPAMISVAIALLIRAIGWPAVVGIAVLAGLLPFAGFVMHRWYVLYAAQAPIKDARVKRINEILQCIRSAAAQSATRAVCARVCVCVCACVCVDLCARASLSELLLTLGPNVLIRVARTGARRVIKLYVWEGERQQAHAHAYGRAKKGRAGPAQRRAAPHSDTNRTLPHFSFFSLCFSFLADFFFFVSPLSLQAPTWPCCLQSARASLR